MDTNSGRGGTVQAWDNIRREAHEGAGQVESIWGGKWE